MLPFQSQRVEASQFLPPSAVGIVLSTPLWGLQNFHPQTAEPWVWEARLWCLERSVYLARVCLLRAHLVMPEVREAGAGRAFGAGVSGEDFLLPKGGLEEWVGFGGGKGRRENTPQRARSQAWAHIFYG